MSLPCPIITVQQVGIKWLVLDLRDQLRDWLSRKWWHEEQYQRIYSAEIANGELDRAVARVAEVFNSQWAAQTGPHPAHGLLLATGTMPLAWLYNLGTDLLALEGVHRLPSVIHDLRQSSHYESTRLEVELAALLRRHGYRVEFRPFLPNERRSDILTCSDQQLYVEVKRLSESRVEASTFHLMNTVVLAVGNLFDSWPDPTLKTRNYKIELADDVIELLGASNDLDSATIGGVVRSLIDGIRNGLTSDCCADFVLPGIASVRVIPKIGDDSSSLAGPPISPQAELKRITRSQLKDAIEQLHPSFPGIVVFQTQGFINRAMTQMVVGQMLSLFGEEASHVSAVLFLPVYSNIPVRMSMFQAFWVPNDSARFPVAELSACGLLSRYFETH